MKVKYRKFGIERESRLADYVINALEDADFQVERIALALGNLIEKLVDKGLLDLSDVSEIVEWADNLEEVDAP